MLSLVCCACIEVVVGYESLTGRQNERVIKELSITGENVLETWHFQSSYAMRPHGDEEKGLNWDDGHTHYNQLSNAMHAQIFGKNFMAHCF